MKLSRLKVTSLALPADTVRSIKIISKARGFRCWSELVRIYLAEGVRRDADFIKSKPASQAIGEALQEISTERAAR